jgi:hypothetical protein
MSFINIQPPNNYKCGFQSTVDFKNAKYCFKYEYGDNGKRCTLVGESKEDFLVWFESLPENKRMLYELIRYTDVVAEYYDIDMKIGESHDVNEMSHNIISTVLAERNEMLPGTVISKKDLIVLSAHTSSKLSLHLISKKTYYKSNEIQHLFAQDLHLRLKKYPYNIDPSVYSNNRCFRMFLNHKWGKTNTLVLFYPQIYNYASFEETWVVLKDYKNRSEIVDYNEETVTIRRYHEPEEMLDGSFREKLQQFVEKYTYFEVTSDHRVNRIEHTTRECLTDPTDKHSTENMFWFVADHKLYIHCFCGKGKPICLGMRDGIIEVNVTPEPFFSTTHTSDDFKHFSDFGSFQTLFDSRITGKGKTTCAMNHARKYERVLVVHHRLSLDDDYTLKYPEYVSYQKGINLPKQTVCFNSLGKVNVSQYDLIIIDEIRSILRQTEMQNMVYSSHMLFNIFENTQIPLIMLDANMTDRDIEFITKHRKDSNAIIIHDELPAIEKEVYIVPHDCKDGFMCKISKTIERGEQIVIIYNISIEKINAFLSKYNETRRILHVNRLTRKTVDMNNQSWFDNYDIIAYSPTISEGVSIVDSRFETTKAFGLFSAASCPAESVSQMIARFRAIKTFHIYIDPSCPRPFPIFTCEEDVLKYANNNLQTLNSISHSKLNVERRNQSLYIIQDEFCELFCKNMYELSIDYNNYQDTLIQKLVNNGYSVFLNFDIAKDLTKDEIALYTNEAAKLLDDEKERICQKIIDSIDLSPDELTRLVDSGVSTPEEEYQVTKYNITHSIHLLPEYLTLDIVAFFREKGPRQKIKNLRQCFSFIRIGDSTFERVSPNILIQEMANQICTHMKNYDTFIDQKRFVTHLNVSKFNWLNQRAQDLGFQYLLSPEPAPLQEYKENIEAILDFYRRNRAEYIKTQQLFGSSTNVTKLNKPSFITDKFLNLLGIKFGVDKSAGLVYQQLSLPIQLCDSSMKTPSLLGKFPLTQNIIEEYRIMFLAGSSGTYCEVCNMHFEHVIGLVHLGSYLHQSKLKAKQQNS